MLQYEGDGSLCPSTILSQCAAQMRDIPRGLMTMRVDKDCLAPLHHTIYQLLKLRLTLSLSTCVVHLPRASSPCTGNSLIARDSPKHPGTHLVDTAPTLAEFLGLTPPWSRLLAILRISLSVCQRIAPTQFLPNISNTKTALPRPSPT